MIKYIIDKGVDFKSIKSRCDKYYTYGCIYLIKRNNKPHLKEKTALINYIQLKMDQVS